MTPAAEPQERAFARARAAADVAVRAAGGLVALAGGALVALLSLLWVPFRVQTWFGPVRVPVAVGIAIAGVLALLWFAPRATGTRWGVVLPMLGWFVVVVPVVMADVYAPPGGGRLLVPGDWVAALTLFGGVVVLMVGGLLAVTGARPAGRRVGDRPGSPCLDDQPDIARFGEESDSSRFGDR